MRNRWYLLILSLFSLLFSTLAAKAGIVGTFKGVKNYPGYINLDKNSYAFKGNPKSPKKDDGIEWRTPSEILNDYIINNEINISKIEALIQEVDRKRDNAFISYCMAKLPKEAKDNFYCRSSNAKDHKKLKKKWKKNKANLSYVVAKRKLKKAIKKARGIRTEDLNRKKGQGFLGDFFDALEILAAFKAEDYQRGSHSGMNGIVVNTANNYVVVKPMIKADRPHATNLLVPKKIQKRFPGQIFLSEDNIKELEREGYDLSLLNPPDSGAWRNPQNTISKINTTNYNKESLGNLRGMSKKEKNDFLKKEKIVDVVYRPDDIRGGQTPKFNVEINGRKFKLKYITDKVGALKTTKIFGVTQVLFNSSEVQTELVVNNLAHALGFSVDPTYYKEKVRLFLPDKYYENGFDFGRQKMLDEISAAFRLNLNIPSAFTIIKKDEKTGREYIEMRSVSLEKKSDNKTDKNIGFFIRQNMGRSLKREHRGLALFLAWINDADVKDENNRVKLEPFKVKEAGKDGEEKVDHAVVFSNSDMGASLGFGMPNYLSEDFVRKVERGHNGSVSKIHLIYKKIYPLEVLNAVNLSDARWFGRLLGQLTYEQIEQAFYATGYPDLIAKVMAKKLMTRRNQFLMAVGLLAPYDGKIDQKADTSLLFKKPDSSYLFAKGPEFNGPLKGYEEFFNEDGRIRDPDMKLHDPERNVFPRYWGADSKLAKKELPQSRVFQILGIGAVNEAVKIASSTISPLPRYSSLSAKNFEFQEMKIQGTDLKKPCQGNCFYQGVDAGAGGFIPIRYVVENPNKDSEKPFWLVDVFRIGLNLGDNGKYIQSKMGFSIPEDMGFKLAGGFYKIYEFMKIRAVKDIREYGKDYKSYLSTPIIGLKGMKKMLVDKMQEDEVLIMSTYLGGSAKTGLGPSSTITKIIPNVSLSLNTALVGRVTFFKETKDSALLSWSRVNRHQIEAALGVKLSFYKVPLVSAGFTSENKIDRTFSFNIRDDQEKKDLLDAFHLYSPRNLDPKYKFNERAIKYRAGHFNIGVGRMVNLKNSDRSIEIKLIDFLEDRETQEIAHERSVNYSRMSGLNSKGHSYNFKASVNEEGKLFVKISVDVYSPDTKKEMFHKIYHKLKPILPRDYIVFDLKDIKHYLGKIEFNSDIIFSDASIKSLLSKSELEVCRAYVEVNNVSNGNQRCEKKRYTGPMWAFLADFDQAKDRMEQVARLKSFDKLDIRRHKRKVKKLLKEIVDIFSRYTAKRGIIPFMKKLVPFETYHQKAHMFSYLSGFPGNIDSIHVSPGSAGGFQPEIRHLADSPEENFEIFTDKIHNTVGMFFKVAPLFYH